eukprot:TRINITY_DN11447_c0_g1_i1.p1 TRINITY_DN11447_c0_g1~~TRINITY_DN11447_c0_g1_i1.p1  ORF type:complete len:214 (-),score=51.81 TRINITY_DN11447_c0_g1_i1:74-715(-)
MWNFYLSGLRRKPVLTKVLTTAVLFGASDLVAQRIQAPAVPNDNNRTCRAVAYGVGYAPVLHHWFIFMEKLIVIPGKPNAQALARLAVQLGLYAPIMGMSTFIGFMALTDPENLFSRDDPKEITLTRASEAAWDRIVTKTFDLWVEGLGFWGPVMFANYRYFALDHRVLATNVAGLIWTTYMSFKTVGHLSEEKDCADVEKEGNNEVQSQALQ